jgi:hypothetical protein
VNKIRTKNVLGILLLVIAMAFLAAAKEKTVASLWTVSPLRIDGVVSEWKDDPLSVEKKEKVDYAFRNDADFLYVLFRFNDLKYLSTIEATGMTLWIDVEGKKKKNLAVNFTKKKISSEEYIVLLEQQQRSVSDEQKEKLRENAFYIISHAEVIAKKGKPLDPGKQSDVAKGSVYNVAALQNIVVYEFRVPLRSLTETMLGKAIEPGESMKIGFEWGGLTDEIRESYMKGKTSGGSGPIGISEGGRGGGGATSVGFSGASPRDLTALRKLTKKYSFWVDVRLAKDEMR